MKRLLVLIALGVTIAVGIGSPSDAACRTTETGGVVCTTCLWAAENQDGSVCIGRMTMCTSGTTYSDMICYN
jgi:hypothetical protein